MSVKRSLVLDGEKGELMKDLRRVDKRICVPEEKAMAALKSHSEAERRRRDRINAHLETLRGLVPSSKKMEKAMLLAEVINQVKQLRKTAKQASEGLNIPMDSDEVKVEMVERNSSNECFLLKASLCCDYRPDLLSELRQAIKSLPVKLLKSEISTLGGRVKSVFVVTASEGKSAEILMTSIRMVFTDILDKVNASLEFDQPLVYPRKRQRVDPSCSSSVSRGGDIVSS